MKNMDEKFDNIFKGNIDKVGITKAEFTIAYS